ncbi:hypothetical protein [Rhodococcus sp. ANT_H53B]|uniref:hypothetical protein n=1 Tax=Rhodococcus sp. ANT_H53B TaxID=2597357 RepID=UPI0011EED019|nr:hypothetical protein [Rhodococcus sp. ANT_H53B]KAA0922048.1 hypothetical protein FQ188_22290 [Rhodococcus sp. ANT_H53B]
MSIPEYVPGPADWAHLDQDSARELWSELVPWVEQVRTRYDLGRVIKKCWFRHPPLLEELTAAMYAHREAYQWTKKNIYHGGMAAWHYQVLWPLMSRMKSVTSFEECLGDTCGYRPTPAPTDPDLAEFIAADVDQRALRVAEPPRWDGVGGEVTELTFDEVLVFIDNGQAIPDDPSDDFSAVDIDGHRWEYDDQAGVYKPAE